MSSRKVGFYWVVFRDEWEPALWDGELWNLNGDESIYGDVELEEIGEMLDIPEQYQ